MISRVTRRGNEQKYTLFLHANMTYLYVIHQMSWRISKVCSQKRLKWQIYFLNVFTPINAWKLFDCNLISRMTSRGNEQKYALFLCANVTYLYVIHQMSQRISKVCCRKRFKWKTYFLKDFTLISACILISRMTSIKEKVYFYMQILHTCM